MVAPARVPTLPLPRDSAFLQRVLDHLQDGVYFVDRTRRITYGTSGAERITGHHGDLSHVA